MVYNISEIPEVCRSVDLYNRSRPDDRPIIRDGSIAFATLTFIYLIFSLCKFYYFQQRYEWLMKRSIFFISISGVGAMCQVIGNSLWLATDYPCWIKFLFLLLVLPLMALSLPIRMLDYYNRNVFARMLLKLLKENEENRFVQDQEITSTMVVPHNGQLPPSPTLGNSSGDNQHNSSITQSDSVKPPQKIVVSETALRYLRILKFLTSLKMNIILVVLMLAPFIILFLVDIYTIPHLNPSANCRGCYLPGNAFILILVAIIGVTLLGLVLVLYARHYPDPFGVLRECFLSTFCGTLVVLGFILDSVITPNKYFTFGWLILLGCNLLVFVTSDYQVYLARKHTPIIIPNSTVTSEKHPSVMGSHPEESQVEPVSNDKALTRTQLRKYLANKEIAEAFENHLVSEFSVELYRMFVEISSFKKDYVDLTVKTRKARVRRIIEFYVADNAISQVNFSAELRIKMTEDANELENIPMDFFNTAEVEILGMLLGAFGRFAKTKVFKDLVENKRKAKQSAT